MQNPPLRYYIIMFTLIELKGKKGEKMILRKWKYEAI